MKLAFTYFINILEKLMSINLFGDHALDSECVPWLSVHQFCCLFCFLLLFCFLCVCVWESRASLPSDHMPWVAILHHKIENLLWALCRVHFSRKRKITPPLFILSDKRSSYRDGTASLKTEGNCIRKINTEHWPMI